jgi:hypothetical protein
MGEVAREEIAATKGKLDKLHELETMAERLAEMDLMRKELDALRSKVATEINNKCLIVLTCVVNSVCC